MKTNAFTNLQLSQNYFALTLHDEYDSFLKIINFLLPRTFFDRRGKGTVAPSITGRSVGGVKLNGDSRQFSKKSRS